MNLSSAKQIRMVTGSFPPANEVAGRLCFYSCLWFCSQGGRVPGQVPPRAGTPPRRCTPLGRYTPPGQVHPSPGNASSDTVNKRAVRVPLECILVTNTITLCYWVPPLWFKVFTQTRVRIDSDIPCDPRKWVQDPLKSEQISESEPVCQFLHILIDSIIIGSGRISES